MPDLSFVFTIFFLTLGPIKTIPTFFQLTKDATAKFRQQTALQATGLALLLSLFIAFVGRNVLGKWRISLEALQISGGLILLLFALKVISMQPQPFKGEKATADTPLSASFKLALTPLTTPTIITPYGVVAILFFMVLAKGDIGFESQIIGLIVLIMFLNYLGMLFAVRIMKTGFVPVLLMLVGWVFAIMQAALGIDVILKAFRAMGVIQTIH